MNPFRRDPLEPPPFDLGIESMLHTEYYKRGYYREAWSLQFHLSLIGDRVGAYSCSLHAGPDGFWEQSELVFTG